MFSEASHLALNLIQIEDPFSFILETPTSQAEHEEHTFEYEGVSQTYLTWPEISTRFMSPWSSACCKFLATDGAKMVAGKRMLELGAGNGLMGLLASQAGATEVSPK